MLTEVGAFIGKIFESMSLEGTSSYPGPMTPALLRESYGYLVQAAAHANRGVDAADDAAKLQMCRHLLILLPLPG